jgi:hypothetical protein
METRIRHKDLVSGGYSTFVTAQSLDAVVKAINAAVANNERWVRFKATDGKERGVVAEDVVLISEA